MIDMCMYNIICTVAWWPGGGGGGGGGAGGLGGWGAGDPDPQPPSTPHPWAKMIGAVILEGGEGGWGWCQ